MSRELWNKCAKTDYSNPRMIELIQKYLPELAGCLVEPYDTEEIYQAIKVLEGLKLKYKLTENTHERTQH